jgi:hypothetical protein
MLPVFEVKKEISERIVCKPIVIGATDAPFTTGWIQGVHFPRNNGGEIKPRTPTWVQ